MKILRALGLVLSMMGAMRLGRASEPYDVVVYGGTSGGVIAAVQASRMGKSVVLIEPTRFLGGLTTGGLGATDIGNKRAIGGLSREFYQRVYRYYASPERWIHETREAYLAKRPASEEAMWTFEPHVATKIYADMIEEANVPVVFGERLDLDHGVIKEGTHIVRLRMESGRLFAATIFIDATYEGDLMAKAGVRYHVGRESNATYGETINGLQVRGAVHHQFIKKVDPFVVSGDRASGLLPGVTAKPSGNDGDADHRIQAYNFRLCTTDVVENQVPWPKPADYDERRYELLLRNFEAGDTRIPWAPSWMPNRKTDTNNNFAFSTDNIGMNYAYPDGDYEMRARIWAEHEQYTQGLMWTLANHPRVPENVRAVFHRISLAKDEFADNGHWPRQLYVREARRMISDYVMSEKNCKRIEIVSDSVGMGAYNMDSHHTQRYVTDEGFARNEGDIQIATRPYPISYRSIRPPADQCTNLLVPVCLSASHISYGSIRMEPVFMVMGQSAATAAALAIDQRVGVQAIDYDKLKQRLLEDRQVLDFESPPLPIALALSKEELGGIVVDDLEAEKDGFVSIGHSIPPFVGSGYAHDGDSNKGTQWIRFKPLLPRSGMYRVAMTYTASSNRASNVPVVVSSAEGEKKIVVNQKIKPSDQKGLFILGTFSFDAGQSGFVEVRNGGTDGHVIADAVQWLLVEN